MKLSGGAAMMWPMSTDHVTAQPGQPGGVDLAAVTAFQAMHARTLDRHRLRLAVGDTDPAVVAAALTALEAYRNPDGGYGWGLEPDLRSATSQTGPALHAFEVFAEIAPATSPRAVELCDWLDSVTLPDGGVPFGLPVPDPAGCAPFWANADPVVSSLQITAIVTANAHRVARHDPAVAAHPWLAKATDYCLATIHTLEVAPFAIELAFAVRFLDAVHDLRPEAATGLDHVRRFIPADGRLPVVGGAPGETLRALDLAPEPDRPVRGLLEQSVIDAELNRLLAEQQPDGGWRVDFDSYSAAAALEWRGYATVSAVATLRANGRL